MGENVGEREKWFLVFRIGTKDTKVEMEEDNELHFYMLMLNWLKKNLDRFIQKTIENMSLQCVCVQT